MCREIICVFSEIYAKNSVRIFATATILRIHLGALCAGFCVILQGQQTHSYARLFLVKK